MKPQIPWLRVFVEGVVIVGLILLMTGCGTTLLGSYSLVSVGGAELPASVEFELLGTTTITVVAGSLTLRSDSTFEANMTFRWDEVYPDSTWASSGKFTLGASNVIHFTPRPESEDDDPSEGEGTWDGDRITVASEDFGAFVYRRRR